jgi:glycosyltransferase involved in cell wall biosynthesis
MTLKNIDVQIITDGYPNLPLEEEMDGISIHRLRRLTTFPFFENSELVTVIKEISPDMILWTIGPTSFYFLKSMKRINAPVIGLWLGTTYSLQEIMNLGFSEITRNFRSIYNPTINTLIPSVLIKYSLNNSIIKKVIVLSENSKEKIIRFNITSRKILVVPPGISDFDLKVPNIIDVNMIKESLNIYKDDFVVLYLGSPLSLRGVDTLINGISIVIKDIPSLKLIILSRRRTNELSKEENYVKSLCIKNKIYNNTKVISSFLPRKEIKKYIDLSDVVVLPFKLVQSDTPMAILEVMALGKPLISTKLDGIPELLKDGRGILINPNDSKNLANALFMLYSNPSLKHNMGAKAKEHILSHPSWNQTTEMIVTIINENLNQTDDSLVKI